MRDTAILCMSVYSNPIPLYQRVMGHVQVLCEYSRSTAQQRLDLIMSGRIRSDHVSSWNGSLQQEPAALSLGNRHLGRMEQVQTATVGGFIHLFVFFLTYVCCFGFYAQR